MIALCATGCFSDRGAAIEVDIGDTRADSVELYLGTDTCDSRDDTKFACAGIAPMPGTSPPLPGSVWLRDALLPYTAKVKGRTATFQLRADTPSMVPIVIAVGLTADGTGVGTATIRDLPVPAHEARVNTVTLTTANKAVPGETTTMAEDRVLVWRKAMPESSCVVVEHWKGSRVERDFVVPAGDPDCDDVPDRECNPNVWHGTRVPGSSPVPDCFAPNTSGVQACVLGSRGCSDLDPKPGICAPQADRVCVPDAFCAPTPSCGRYDEACLRTLVMNAEIPHIDCSVPTLSAVCSDDTATIDLTTQYQGSQCDQQPTISSLSLEGFHTSATFGGAAMELQSPQPGCKFDIRWKSGTRTALSPTDYGLVKVPTRQGALLLPIVLNFHADACATPFECKVTGNALDKLWNCAP